MERLKYLREQQGTTQKDIAHYINKTPQAYSLYEKGTREPDLETLKKLATFFSVSIDKLIGYTPPTKQAAIPMTADEELVLKKYRALSESGKERIQHQLDFEYQQSLPKKQEPAM